MILIQRITTEWTKASRGNQGATVRNSFRDAYALPPIAQASNSFIVHTVRFQEWDNFELRENLTESSSSADAEIEPLRISVKTDHLAVRFIWDWMHCGAPERHSHEIFHVRLGDWGRFICNGRFGPTSPSGCVWHYHKTVFNIAFVKSFVPGLFVDSKPRSVQDRLAILR